MRRHRRIIGVAGLAAALLAGCDQGLKQDRQVAVIRAEPGTEAVTVLMVYQGLHVATPDDPKSIATNTDSAKQELGRFVAGGRTFGTFLFGSITGITLGPVAEDGPDAAAERRKFSELIDVRNVAFLLDPRRGLCVRQEIKILRPDVLAATCNAFISAEIARDPDKVLGVESAGNPLLAGGGRAAIVAAAKAGHDWIRVGPGRISANIPLSPEDAAAFVRRIEAEPRDREAIAALKGSVAGFDLKAGPDGLTCSIGDGRRRTIAIRPADEPAHQPRRDAELIAHARTLPLPFLDDADVDAAIRQFEAE